MTVSGNDRIDSVVLKNAGIIKYRGGIPYYPLGKVKILLPNTALIHVRDSQAVGLDIPRGAVGLDGFLSGDVAHVALGSGSSSIGTSGNGGPIPLLTAPPPPGGNSDLWGAIAGLRSDIQSYGRRLTSLEGIIHRMDLRLISQGFPPQPSPHADEAGPSVQ